MASAPFQLLQRTGPAPGKQYSLAKSEIYIGRDITNDIVINDPEVSRKHARLTVQSGGYLLEDLGSTNGTFIDGQRITGPHMMSPREVIMLGDNVSLVYEAVAGDPEATVAVMPDQMATPIAPSPQMGQPMPERGLAYSGQVPPGTAPIGQPRGEEGPANTRVWILAGCGCLVLLLCAIAGGLIIFDSLNLYCTPPFDAFLCPP